MFIYDTWNPRSAITDELALEFTDGALVKRWLHGPRVDEPLGFERYAGTTAPGSGAAHEVIADRLGSVLGVVDVASGQMAGAYRYDAFGARTVTGEAIRYGFTGREHDASGLIYYRARHFDPQTGRFLQADPIGFAAGDLNIYAYVWNDPFNWTDPSGLAVTADWAVNTGRAAGIAGVVAGIRNAVFNLANQIARALSSNIVRQAVGSGSGAGGGSGGGDDDGGDDDDCRPNDPNCQEEGECLSPEAQRAIRSYERQIAKHEAKIAEFMENPTIRPGMEGLPEELIRAQQAARIRHLEREIETFRNNINKLKCR